jgi:tRNA threonylcarbamoyladenosine biosynthesis protein TsaE
MPDLELVVPTAEEMRKLGRELAGALAAGDLVLLTGDLGAGKTTLTQGIGAGLGVQGTIASPTFVIARVHRSAAGGPPLVHVDAYRLGGWDELEDLDLEASLDEAVTVVEWGTGIAEGLADRRLEIEIVRTHGGEPGEGSEDRIVRVRAIGRELPRLASAVAE